MMATNNHRSSSNNPAAANNTNPRKKELLKAKSALSLSPAGPRGMMMRIRTAVPPPLVSPVKRSRSKVRLEQRASTKGKEQRPSLGDFLSGSSNHSSSSSKQHKKKKNKKSSSQSSTGNSTSSRSHSESSSPLPRVQLSRCSSGGHAGPSPPPPARLMRQQSVPLNLTTQKRTTTTNSSSRLLADVFHKYSDILADHPDDSYHTRTPTGVAPDEMSTTTGWEEEDDESVHQHHRVATAATHSVASQGSSSSRPKQHSLLDHSTSTSTADDEHTCSIMDDFSKIMQDYPDSYHARTGVQADVAGMTGW